MQLRVVEIERACKVPTKYRYPFFQKVMWYAMIKYLEDDPLPDSVRLHFYAGNKFYRARQPYLDMDKHGPGSDPGEENYQARYYSKQELGGLPDFVSYIFRSLMIHLDQLDGITQETRKAVTRSIPKNKGEPVELARTFAIWVAWKRGNEDIPIWAHPNGPLEATPDPEKKVESVKKITAAEMKKWEKLAPVKGYQPPVYQPVAPPFSFVDGLGDQSDTVTDNNSATAPKTSILGPKRTACDTCRKRKMRCKHMPESPPITRTAIGVVIDRQPSTKMRTMLAPGPNGAGVMVAGVMLTPEHIGRQRDPSVTAAVVPPVEQPDATSSSDGKKGRNKACADCRRSKVFQLICYLITVLDNPNILFSVVAFTMRTAISIPSSRMSRLSHAVHRARNASPPHPIVRKSSRRRSRLITQTIRI
jgi:F-box/leucine-rich repeat protein 10/11